MNVNELIKWIKSLNSSIVTLNSVDGAIQYDVNSKKSEFSIGYEAGHEFLFRSFLQYRAVAVVVREFLPKLKNEKIPIKNLYMFYGREGVFLPIRKEEVEIAMNTDCITGEKLKREKKVVYCEKTL